MPSGTIQSGKGLQNKSQFRTIAPKIVPKVLTSRVLSGHSPSLSDQVTPGPPVSSTPLGVPTQNYALMQVTGPEGTFSLVALPHVASAQPVQKRRLSLPQNLKLPIPRYQPPRNNKGSTKNSIRSSSENSCSKPPVQTQTSPSLLDHSEPQPRPSPPDPALSLNPAPAGLSAATLTNDHGQLDRPDTPALSTPEQPSAKRGFLKISGKENFASKETSSKPSVVASEKHKEQVDLAKSTIRLSPAIFGSALQLVPSAPKGKLPILPYSRMKTTEAYKNESAVHTVDLSLPGLRADCDKTSTIAEGFDATAKMATKVPSLQVSKQSPCESAFCSATKLDLNHKPKLNGGAAKRKGRKLKVPDEILSFQEEKRKCKRIKNDPQQSRDQKAGAMKKYRSIMPKPVVVTPAVTPLASPAAVPQSQRPSGPGQDILLSDSLTPKYLSCKQDNSSSSPKPSSAFRSGFSGIKKPWHRCPVCNHHFQFKQHLQDHMNTHTNRRPYSCRICRKTYVRSGSLSSHVKLHHSENRPRKLVCCEFCAKVFGHVRVYFGHLKEVHRVVISTESSPGELLPGDAPKSRDTEVAVQRDKSSPEEDLLLNQADEIKLQIKCGRCQIAAQTFAEIKFHLLSVHGEEIQGRLQEELSPRSQAAAQELARHAAPSWKQRPERRKLLEKPRPSDEEVHAVPTLRRQLCLHRQNDKGTITKDEGAQPGPSEPGEAPQGPACPSPHSAPLQSQPGFHCVLCARTLGKKEELLLHWQQGHNCEDAPGLWRILKAFSHQGAVGLPGDTGE
ncbi:zinc finger protein 438 isoform X2 [Artibeus jamaicensis]|nr:zinc finger protein 438 isoform X2 [Artibeus jamaicensis]XP_037021354.2 zinc finger protein 438 isoform X2 [Artibeus jamaicensis]XP_053529462.1 zinc finger protein 438 isoform X2 [Artibeus jamaicensis]